MDYVHILRFAAVFITILEYSRPILLKLLQEQKNWSQFINRLRYSVNWNWYFKIDPASCIIIVFLNKKNQKIILSIVKLIKYCIFGRDLTIKWICFAFEQLVELFAAGMLHKPHSLFIIIWMNISEIVNLTYA